MWRYSSMLFILILRLYYVAILLREYTYCSCYLTKCKYLLLLKAGYFKQWQFCIVFAIRLSSIHDNDECDLSCVSFFVYFCFFNITKNYIYLFKSSSRFAEGVDREIKHIPLAPLTFIRKNCVTFCIAMLYLRYAYVIRLLLVNGISCLPVFMF